MLNLIDFLGDLEKSDMSQVEATNLLYSEISHKKDYSKFEADYGDNKIVKATLNDFDVKIASYKAYIYQKLLEI